MEFYFWINQYWRFAEYNWLDFLSCSYLLSMPRLIILESHSFSLPRFIGNIYDTVIANCYEDNKNKKKKKE